MSHLKYTWAALALLLALGGCAALPGSGRGGAELTPVLPAAAPAVAPRGPDGRMLAVAVAPWADQRPGAPGRHLGEIQAPVFGLHARTLALDRDATALVGEAVAGRLQAMGLLVVAPSAPADLRLDGALQALSLTVAARDERHVALQATLRAADGRVLWAGLVEDRDDRFAGVSGNNRADLERYLGAGIGQVADRLAAQVRDRIAGAAAQLPPPPQPAAAAGPTPALASVPAATPAAAPGTGFVAITTVPARVKVYVDDVYHGLTPMTLELPAGVSQLHFKRDGYRSVSEKVAVRRGATLELELQLQR